LLEPEEWFGGEPRNAKWDATDQKLLILGGYNLVKNMLEGIGDDPAQLRRLRDPCHCECFALEERKSEQ
jgi:hypothetical protein